MLFSYFHYNSSQVSEISGAGSEVAEAFHKGSPNPRRSFTVRVSAFNPSFFYRFTSTGQMAGKRSDCLILMLQWQQRYARHFRNFFISFILAPALLKSILHATWTVVFNSLDLLNICYLLHLHGISQLSSDAADCYPSSSFLLAPWGLTFSTTELSIFHTPEELVTSTHKFQQNLRRY